MKRKNVRTRGGEEEDGNLFRPRPGRFPAGGGGGIS